MLLLIRLFPTSNNMHRTNLHSTMLLLIPARGRISRRSISHLHSTMLLLIQTHRLHFPSSSAFTFHYASTYTPPLTFAVSDYLSFTFHYASTYATCDLYRCDYDRDLHSTMLLLIPGDRGAATAGNLFTFHYASTYTRLPPICFCRFHIFTFHYASTYTQRNHGNLDSHRIYIPLCFYLYTEKV